MKNLSGRTRFFLFSIIGIILFFIPINGKITIEYITGFIFPLLNQRINIFLLLGIGILSIIQKPDNKFIFGMNILGLICAAILYISPIFKFEFFNFVLGASTTLARAAITVSITTIFVPFLLNYGLIETVGSFTKPVMRKIFKLPGQSAVVCASSTLGSSLVGILGAEHLYNTNRITKSESAIITTGFSTLSVGFMVFISTVYGFSNNFGLFFLSILLVTWLITIITARIPPISILKDDKQIIIESEPKFSPKEALNAGIEVATKAPIILISLKQSFERMLKVIPSMITSALFLSVVVLFINNHTDLLYYIGLPFVQILRLFNIGGLDIIARTIGISLVDTMPAVAYSSTFDLPMATKYILAVFPISTIVYFGAYYICLSVTNVKLKLSTIFFTWLIRISLSLLFLGIIASIVF